MRRPIMRTFLLLACIIISISSSSLSALSETVALQQAGALGQATNERKELFELITNTFRTELSKSHGAINCDELEGIIAKIASNMPLSTAENAALALIHPIGASLLVGLDRQDFNGEQQPVIEALDTISNTISGYELEQLPSMECTLFVAQLEALGDLLSLDIVYSETNSAISSFPYVAVISRAVIKDGLEVQPPMLIYNTIPENIAANIPAVAAFRVDSTKPSAAPTAKSSTQSTQKPSSKTTYQQPKVVQPTATPASYFVFTSPTTAAETATIIVTASPVPTILMSTVQPPLTPAPSPTTVFSTPTATVQTPQTPSPTNSPTPTVIPSKTPVAGASETTSVYSIVYPYSYEDIVIPLNINNPVPAELLYLDVAAPSIITEQPNLRIESSGEKCISLDCAVFPYPTVGYTFVFDVKEIKSVGRETFTVHIDNDPFEYTFSVEVSDTSPTFSVPASCLPVFPDTVFLSEAFIVDDTKLRDYVTANAILGHEAFRRDYGTAFQPIRLTNEIGGLLPLEIGDHTISYSVMIGNSQVKIMEKTISVVPRKSTTDNYILISGINSNDSCRLYKSNDYSFVGEIKYMARKDNPTTDYITIHQPNNQIASIAVRGGEVLYEEGEYIVSTLRVEVAPRASGTTTCGLTFANDLTYIFSLTIEEEPPALSTHLKVKDIPELPDTVPIGYTFDSIFYSREKLIHGEMFDDVTYYFEETIIGPCFESFIRQGVTQYVATVPGEVQILFKLYYANVEYTVIDKVVTVVSENQAAPETDVYFDTAIYVEDPVVSSPDTDEPFSTQSYFDELTKHEDKAPNSEIETPEVTTVEEVP